LRRLFARMQLRRIYTMLWSITLNVCISWMFQDRPLSPVFPDHS
jgi:hypothetical protein